MALSDKWYMSYYGDVGTGDSDLTWQGRLGLGYRFDSVDAIFGYRYLDYDVGGTDIHDITIKGPYAGVKMHFCPACRSTGAGTCDFLARWRAGIEIFI